MEELEGLAYDDPHSSSDVTVMGADSPSGPQLSSHDGSADSLPNSSRGLAPHSLGSPMEQMPSGMDTVEVHVPQVELDNL